MPTTLVLGYDGSETGKKALAHTAELARHLDDGEVFVVNAYEFSIGYVPMGMTDSPLMISAEYDQHVDLVRSACDQQIARGGQGAAGRRRARPPARRARASRWTCCSRRRARSRPPPSSSAATARVPCRRRSSAPPRSSCCTTATSPCSWCRGTTEDDRK